MNDDLSKRFMKSTFIFLILFLALFQKQKKKSFLLNLSFLKMLINTSTSKIVHNEPLFLGGGDGGYKDDNLPSYPGNKNISIPLDYSCVDMNTSI